MSTKNLSRRNFLKGSAATGGLLSLGFTIRSRAENRFSTTADPSFAPNAFIRINSDNTTDMVIGNAEMGQNVVTGLPMILAEELDADWDHISVKFAPVDPAYNNPAFGAMGTGGSTSTYMNYDPLRRAGATARAMLVSAAAQQWQVDSETLKTKNSHVINPANGEQLSYGQLSKLAATLPVPKDVALKPQEQFRIIGKEVKRTDSRAKVDGTADFGIDVQLPDMKFAAVAHPPVFGATIQSVDDSTAKTMPGVLKIKSIASGVAVIADSFWRAKKARDALKIEWNEGSWSGTNSAKIDQQYRELVEKPGAVAAERGDTPKAFSEASKVIEAIYDVPFLAHATMEPLNCTVHDHGESADVYVGSQFQTADRGAAAAVLGYPPEQVNLHNQYLGGGFGRRASKTSDFVTEAAMIAKGEPWPVKMVWTREDDMTSGYYRPKYTHKGRLALDNSGNITGWEHRVVGQRVMIGGFVDAAANAPFDGAQVEGLRELPYSVDNFRLEAHPLVTPVTTLWWRSVGHSHTAFAMESLVDEAAHAAGADPVAYRRELYRNHPRMLALLEKVAEMSGWGQDLPKGTALGVAVHDAYAFKGICAQVAQVRVDGKQYHVEKVWCAIDCGFAVNPNGVRAQMESCINFGLNGVIGQISFDNGRVVETNYHNYKVARMNETPDIEVAIINSGAEMGGIGEPGLPPIAPAITNAIFAATGKRIRKLPIEL